jgi:hypothetical protein
LTLSIAVLLSGCNNDNSKTYRLNFSDLSMANRIVVKSGGEGSQVIATITDMARVQSAVRYIMGKPDGWREGIGGPRAGLYFLHFYKDQQLVGVLGLSPTYLVWGGIGPYHDVNAAETDGFMKSLGIHW